MCPVYVHTIIEGDVIYRTLIFDYLLNMILFSVYFSLSSKCWGMFKRASYNTRNLSVGSSGVRLWLWLTISTNTSRYRSLLKDVPKMYNGCSKMYLYVCFCWTFWGIFMIIFIFSNLSKNGKLNHLKRSFKDYSQISKFARIALTGL